MDCKEEMVEDEAGVRAVSSCCSGPEELSVLLSSSWEDNVPSIQLAKMADIRCMTPFTVLLRTSSGWASGPVSDQSPLRRRRFIGGIPLLPLPFPLLSVSGESSTELKEGFGKAEAPHDKFVPVPADCLFLC